MTLIHRLYFRDRWINFFRAFQIKEGMTVLEVGSGAADVIPRALCVCCENADYITANMNERLTAGFYKKAEVLSAPVFKKAGIKINLKVIKDDAANIDKHLDGGSVDFIVFEHSVNDVLQAILAENNGMNTTKSDWFLLLPKMIKLMNKEHEGGTLVRQTVACGTGRF